MGNVAVGVRVGVAVPRGIYSLVCVSLNPLLESVVVVMYTDLGLFELAWTHNLFG